MVCRAALLMRAPFGEYGFESLAFRFGPDGEMEIIPRFYRGVPGSSPGRGIDRFRDI